tara:strand:- start:229 stop:576 length:348 start_codon:yes stop_codon:yes gene_type:complete
MKKVLRAICAQYMQPMHSISSTYLCRNQGGVGFGQLTLLGLGFLVVLQLTARRLLSASDHASGCLSQPSASQLFGQRWPARLALFRHGHVHETQLLRIAVFVVVELQVARDLRLL